MAESIAVSGTTRQEKYLSLLPQIRALVAGEPDKIANLSNIMAALKSGMDYYWVGIYFVQAGKQELVLGPFQGPVACTRIGWGKGVCGTAWQHAKTLIVPDVDQFPGHIACSSDSRSEIVVPVMKGNEVIAVLDVDSDRLNDFNETDQRYLQEVADIIAGFSGE